MKRDTVPSKFLYPAASKFFSCSLKLCSNLFPSWSFKLREVPMHHHEPFSAPAKNCCFCK